MAAARVALVVLALGASAWFALGFYQAREQTRASDLIQSPGTPSPATTAEILRLLDRAGTLNPDRAVAVLRSQAQLRAGDPAAARRTVEGVLRDEPKDIDAWVIFGFAAEHQDPAAAALARARERQLDPLVPAAR
jgi:hypothetical protein